MTKRTTAALAALIAIGNGVEAQELRTIGSSRVYRGERELNVVVRFGLGEFHLERETGDALYRANVRYVEDFFDPIHEYDATGHELRLGIDGHEDGNVQWDDIKDKRQRIDLTISPAVRTSLQLEFGAGRADVDLGGLALERASISTGASESRVHFSRPTVAPCELLDIEVGAAEFQAIGLGNANCKRIEFDGAAGKLGLDFTGEWQQAGTTQADISIGLGGLTLTFPSHLGVHIELSRLLASFNEEGFVKRGNGYYSENYDRAAAKLDINLQAMVGDVDVVWVR
jgi:hypothetical protein